jgi:hypothetical protein
VLASRLDHSERALQHPARLSPVAHSIFWRNINELTANGCDPEGKFVRLEQSDEDLALIAHSSNSGRAPLGDSSRYLIDFDRLSKCESFNCIGDGLNEYRFSGRQNLQKVFVRPDSFLSPFICSVRALFC